MTNKLKDFLGDSLEDDFLEFDLTEIQDALEGLRDIEPVDIAHAEQLQRLALRGADIIAEYLGKIVKTVSYLESKVNSAKNKAALEYQAPEGTRTTADLRKWASEASPEVEAIHERLAKAKGSKIFLEKKYDILIRSHHYHKDIAAGLRKTILGYPLAQSEKVAEGYE